MWVFMLVCIRMCAYGCVCACACLCVCVCGRGYVCMCVPICGYVCTLKCAEANTCNHTIIPLPAQPNTPCLNTSVCRYRDAEYLYLGLLYYCTLSCCFSSSSSNSIICSTTGRTRKPLVPLAATSPHPSLPHNLVS